MFCIKMFAYFSQRAQTWYLYLLECDLWERKVSTNSLQGTKIHLISGSVYIDAQGMPLKLDKIYLQR